MKSYRLSWLLGTALCIGCVPHTDEPKVASAPPPAATPAAPASTPATDPAVSAPAATVPDPATAAPATPVTPPAAATGIQTPPATEQVSAKAGVGLKGQSLQNESGVMVEAAKAYFKTQQRVVFEIEIPKNLQLFEATEGRAPRSHDEFMEKIIKQYNVKLPELPAGQKYVYDPERKELMVEKPAAK